ncbi:MAG: variant repeat protein [Hyphomicrobiales bacterium]|nr:variant repeat protein [Hyphomicrobiales bacterium]
MTKPMLEYRIEEEGPVFTELYLLDDRLHRDDGPAAVMHRTADGAVAFELWYREGRLHREDGPAAVYYDFETGRVQDMYYFRDGALFRDDAGPESLDFDVQTGRLRDATWWRDNEPQKLTWTRWLWLTRAKEGGDGGDVTRVRKA